MQYDLDIHDFEGDAFAKTTLLGVNMLYREIVESMEDFINLGAPTSFLKMEFAKRNKQSRSQN